jgi:molybdopterin converting factor small subunit
MAEGIHVQVKLFGHLRQSSPQHGVELEMPLGSTVSDLVSTLSEILGDDFRQALLDSNGNLHGGIEVVINEEHLPARKIASIVLPGISMVYFVPMIEGG